MSEIVVIDHRAVKGRILDRIRELIPLGKTIHIKNIQSSNVHEIKYLPRTKRLFVTFKSGRRYRYENVQKNVVENFAKAQSKGKFMWKNVIGEYPTKRMKSSYRNAVKRDQYIDVYEKAADLLGVKHLFSDGFFRDMTHLPNWEGGFFSSDWQNAIILTKRSTFLLFKNLPRIEVKQSTERLYRDRAEYFINDVYGRPDDVIPLFKVKSISTKFTPNAVYDYDNYIAFATSMGEKDNFLRGDFKKIPNTRPLAGVLVSNDGRSVIIAERTGVFSYYEDRDPNLINVFYNSPSRNMYYNNFNDPNVTDYLRNLVKIAAASIRSRNMRYKNYSQKDAAIRSTNREQAKQAFAKGQSVKFSKEKSKMVRGIKYVPATKRLTVVFDNGDQYEYTGVSPKMALDMAVSNEPGAFYLEYIRGRIPSTQTVNQ